MEMHILVDLQRFLRNARNTCRLIDCDCPIILKGYSKTI